MSAAVNVGVGTVFITSMLNDKVVQYIKFEFSQTSKLNPEYVVSRFTASPDILKTLVEGSEHVNVNGRVGIVIL